MKKLSYFLLLSLLISATCKKNFVVKEYNFVLGVKAFPDFDSISVNDTIWIEINESTTLNDVLSSNAINYSGASNLGSSIGFQEVLSATQFRNVANSFKFKLISGIETANANPELYREFLFVERNNAYIFKLGIVPKITGVFRFVLSDASNVFRKGDLCSKAHFKIDFKNTNQHFYLFPGGAGTSPGGGTYYFKVK